MKKVQIIRQGDVFIKLHQDKPADAEMRKDKTLALGEVTGHHHTILTQTAEVYGVMEGVQWVVAKEESALAHQEHDTVTLPVGTHEIVIQREYSPEAERRVLD